MTVPARLEALEAGQVKILDKLGNVQEEVGKLTGIVQTSISSSDSLAAQLHELCEVKHDRVDSRLESLENVTADHHSRLHALERRSMVRIGNWSLLKKSLVAFGSFVAFAGTVTGIVAAVFSITVR